MPSNLSRKSSSFFSSRRLAQYLFYYSHKNETLNRSIPKKTNKVQYYLSGAAKTAAEFNETARSHWEVENKLCWSLDISMNEDRDKKWADQSAKNFSLLRQIAINLLKEEKTKKVSDLSKD